MYIIIAYDVSVHRVNKLCQFLRRYLNWVQNSVFEGEVSESKFEKIKIEMKKLLDIERDSVMIYIMQNRKGIQRETIGVEKNEITNIL